MNTSNSIAELAKALSAAQGEMTFAAKSSKNPFFKSSYADLASVWEACRGPLAAHGLAVIQNVQTDYTPEMRVSVVVETILTHSSGEWSQSAISVPVLPTVVERGQPPVVTPQGIGSAMTYARRYALAATLGIAQADDDGNASSGKGEAKAEPVKMADEALANHQAAIEGADTLECLKAVWVKSVEAAGDDQEALRHLTAVKDVMKSRLTTPKADVVARKAEK